MMLLLSSYPKTGSSHVGCPPTACGNANSSFPMIPKHLKSITSTANPFVKHCVKLRQSSSYRHAHGSLLLVGQTPLREIIRYQELMQQNLTIIHCLLLLDKATLPQDLEKNHHTIHVVRVTSTVMKKLSGLQSTESIEAVSLMRIPIKFHNLDDTRKGEHCHAWFPSPRRILVLDGIQDPGNLGTLIRSAMSFGWGGVFLLPGCSDPFNEKALRASRGAAFQVPIVCGNWVHLNALCHEFQMKMLAGHPETTEISKPVSLLSYEFVNSLTDTNLCFVLGSEGRGLSEQARQACELVSIPMSGGFESLNVSVAGGIFLYMLQLVNQS